jgi:hypothetical protein
MSRGAPDVSELKEMRRAVKVLNPFGFTFCANDFGQVQIN